MEDVVPYEKDDNFVGTDQNPAHYHDGRYLQDGLILLDKINVDYHGIKSIKKMYYIPSIDKFGYQILTERETYPMVVVDSHELRTKYNIKREY